MGSKKPQSIPLGMERPDGLPTSPPPPRVGGDWYYKAKIQDLAAWLASEEIGADASAKDAWEHADQLNEKRHSGKANMAFRARAWIRENVKGLK